jgi:hypothetical protein
MSGLTFNDLTVFEFNDIRVPVDNVKTNYAYSLAIHRMFKGEGNYIEPCGRESIIVEADLQFVNNLDMYPRAFLSNTNEPLFPDQWQSFRDMSLKNKSALLKTPDGLEFFAYISEITTISGSKLQNGLIARVKFIETSEFILKQVFAKNDVNSMLQTLEIGILVSEDEKQKNLMEQLISAIRTVQGTFDKIKLQSQLYTSYVNRVVAISQELIDSLLTTSMDDFIYAPSTIALLNKFIKFIKNDNSLKDNVQYSYNSQATNDLIASQKAQINEDNKTNTTSTLSQQAFIEQVKDKIKLQNKEEMTRIRGNKKVYLYYFVEADTPLMEICRQTKNDLVSLVDLNPFISGKIVVPKETVVTYLYKD